MEEKNDSFEAFSLLVNPFLNSEGNYMDFLKLVKSLL
jgi:hypothetical protein